MKKVFFVLAMVFASCVSFAYTISNNGKDFIKSIETLQLTAYWDCDGYSIGYGHHSADVKKGQTITKKKANYYFDNDIKETEKYVNYLLSKLPYKYKFSQGFIDGLTSMVYNAGVGNIQKSTFYSRLKKCRVKNGVMNKSDFDYTMASVKSTCITCPGHKDRRLKEYAMMIK